MCGSHLRIPLAILTASAHNIATGTHLANVRTRREPEDRAKDCGHTRGRERAHGRTIASYNACAAAGPWLGWRSRQETANARCPLHERAWGHECTRPSGITGDLAPKKNWRKAANRTELKTQKHIHTLTSVGGARCMASKKRAVAMTWPMARRPKAPLATMIPSPTKTTPLISCSAAPITEGRRAARRTSGRGVKRPSKGSPKI